MPVRGPEAERPESTRLEVELDTFDGSVPKANSGLRSPELVQGIDFVQQKDRTKLILTEYSDHLVSKLEELAPKTTEEIKGLQNFEQSPSFQESQKVKAQIRALDEQINAVEKAKSDSELSNSKWLQSHLELLLNWQKRLGVANQEFEKIFKDKNSSINLKSKPEQVIKVNDYLQSINTAARNLEKKSNSIF